ncbi:hypothetical protein MAR_036263, partial [Mya arenaria]
LVISTFQAADNGLVYIRGQGDACKRVTSSGLAYYEFDFADCNIQWEMLFRVVIQKNSGYQTGADKVIPIFCVADTSDFDVKARYCVASGLVIIDEFCSTDTDLFPNFSRFKRGYLMSEFGAFRSTSMQSGPCIAQVKR